MTAARLTRFIFVLLLIIVLMIALLMMISWEQAVQLLREPQVAGAGFREWVDQYPLIAPILFVGAYCAVALLMLPLWWLQVLAGVGFGVVGGIIWVQLAAVLASVIGVNLSRWVARDWFQKRVESRMPRLRAIEEKLGHNGFLIVIAVRLLRGIPFGALNYAIGLTRISIVDVVSGTVLGAAPTITIYVTLGADPLRITDIRFIATVVAMVLLLLIPIGLRYWRPQWFRRIGIE